MSKAKILEELAKRAESGADSLAMDFASRMQRAKEQGFDTDTTYYHGTNADFDEFRVNDDGVNLVGKGVYAAPSGTASGYASDVGSSVYPLLVKGKKASFQDAADAREAIGDGWTNDSVNDWLKDRGFTHRDGRQGIVIFDHEKNIRSPNAAFDPAKKDSSNLLASAGAGIGALGLMGASDDSEASFIGSVAKTWSKGAEALAKKMADEGASRDDIWQATGQMGSPTFKDVDGKWKQEISDQGVSFKDAYTKTLGNGITIGESKASSLGAGVNSDILNAYPEMQAYPLGAVWSDNPQAASNWGGSFGKSRKDISASGMTEKDALSTVMHESQHGIQELEGFASGGSLSDGFGKELRKKRIAANKVIEETGEQMKRNIQIRDRLEAEGASKERLKPYEDEYKQLISQRMKVIPDAQISNIDIAEADNRGYRRLAGEAEARNVQTRLDYDMDKRIANPPWSTLDVPESELIVRGQKGQATVPGMIGGAGLGLAGLLAMEGEPYRNQTAQAARYPVAGSIADTLGRLETPIGRPFAGLSDYVNKINYGDDIGILDRLGAVPDPYEFSKLLE